MNESDFASLYSRFEPPIAALDCGERCAPHNERGVPFCCDLAHAVPTAYQAEWNHLQAQTTMWRPWQGRTAKETAQILAQVPDGQIPIACMGHTLCQRTYRSITCRSFPFFPYISRSREFIGMSYYWDYEDRCWVISNLNAVTLEYRSSFIAVYDELFERMPDEREAFRRFSSTMRRAFAQRGRAIPLLHRNGRAYKVTPRNGRLRRVDPAELPAFGPYQIARELPFPDEEGIARP
jgi:hypothetical protein